MRFNLISLTICFIIQCHLYTEASQLEAASKKRTNVEFFEHKGHTGNKHTVTVTQGECHNLDGFNDVASSVKYYQKNYQVLFSIG